jgi:hypothetical protein
MKTPLSFLLGLVILSVCTGAEAFPDLIRHHYVSCRTCHVSLSGGGVLTEYGRALSGELVSKWGTEQEARLLHGAIESWRKPEWLIAGGNIRILQIHKDTPQTTQGTTIPMQFELDLGIQWASWSFVSSFMKLDPIEKSIKPSLVRAYALYQNEEGFSSRVGQFAPNFGIGIPYHTLATRDPIGLGRDSERLGGEIGWLKDSVELSLGLGESQRLPTKTEDKNSFLVAQISWSFYDSGRIGAGYLVDDQKKMVSLNALLGFQERFTYLTDFVLLETKSPANRGMAHFSQFLWEQSKGLSFYLVEDYLKTDWDNDLTLNDSYGAGVRFNPRPHLDFDFTVLKKRIAAVADRYDDWLWLQSHYYF